MKWMFITAAMLFSGPATAQDLRTTFVQIGDELHSTSSIPAVDLLAADSFADVWSDEARCVLPDGVVGDAPDFSREGGRLSLVDAYALIQNEANGGNLDWAALDADFNTVLASDQARQSILGRLGDDETRRLFLITQLGRAAALGSQRPGSLYFCIYILTCPRPR